MQKELRPTRPQRRQVETMSTKPSQFDAFAIGTPVATIPMGMRILAIVLRALFIGALVAVTIRVSSPQSAQSKPNQIAGGLVYGRKAFMLPRTAEGYRTWVYLGLVVAPLALVAAIVIW